MKNTSYLLILLVCLGCNRTLTSLDYAPENASKGVYYNLPKSIIKVQIDYTVKRDYNLVNGKKAYTSNPYAMIEAPIRVSTISVPDTSKRYILTYKKQNSTYFFEDNYAIEVGTDDGLKSVNWETENVMPDIFSNLISTGLNVFKTISPAAEGINLANAETLIGQYEAEIRALDEKILEHSKNKPDQLKKLIGQQELLTLRMAKLKLLNKRDQQESKEVSQTVYLNLENDYKNNPFITKTFGSDDSMLFVIDLKSRFKGIDEDFFPKLRFALPPLTAKQQAGEGIKYRLPQTVAYSIDLMDPADANYPERRLVMADLTILQYGEVNSFPMKVKGSKKSKIALTIDEKTGLITKVSNTSNSIIKESSALAIASSEEILKIFDNYKFNKAKTGLANEKELLELMQSIEELNRREPAASEMEVLIAQLKLELEKLQLEQEIKELQDSGQ